jgi:3-methylcrotonyl-CoA carboxylase alpha subunit
MEQVTAIRKLLIANRGEIAVRIIRACRELGVIAIAVYSEADHDALHVRLADEAYPIGPAPAVESYLNLQAIVEAARRSGADAVHPGYGFLSERAHFAEACASAGLRFVGPPAAAIALMGSKIAAKRLAVANDVPVVPGYDGDDQRAESLAREAERIGFPVLIKASAGGGGRGMRVVDDPAGFATALEGAKREALAAFGDDTVLLEKLILRPRHVEFQVFADNYDNVVHLGERECSIQRRHQKIVEESPCVALDERLRGEMGGAAVRLARAAGYRNAGTVEFMLDADGAFYFLEVNTRLQVEHPVTELVTGYDLVHLQIRVAAGERLPFTQEEVRLRGHAIEARVYAEDPATFLPATGPVLALIAPEGPGIRNDPGVEGGDDVTVHYDPMVAKLIVYAPDRAAAVARLRRAIDDYAVLGLTTNLSLLRDIVAHPAFAAGETHTGFLEETGLACWSADPSIPPEVLVAATIFRTLDLETQPDPFAVLWRGGGAYRHRFVAGGMTHTAAIDRLPGAADAPSTYRPSPIAFNVVVDDQPMRVEVVARRGVALFLRFGSRQERFYVARRDRICYLHWRGVHYRLQELEPLDVDALALGSNAGSGQASLQAPMSGTIVKLLVEQGQRVSAGQPLVVLEAMKMEHAIAAPHAGVVSHVYFQAGQIVDSGAILVDLQADPDAADIRIA